jgi:hypothetical protein
MNWMDSKPVLLLFTTSNGILDNDEDGKPAAIQR